MNTDITPPNTDNSINRIVASTIRMIDRTNEVVGRTVSWLVVLMVLTTFVVAILRYGFSLGWVWFQESYVWMHAIVFMLVSGYTYLHDGHVRVDLIYASRGPRYRAWVNLLGVVFLLSPTLVTIFWTSYPYVSLSWQRLERSGSSDGLPGLFLLKTSILLFVVFLALQGLSVVLKSLLVICNRGSEKLYQESNNQ